MAQNPYAQRHLSFFRKAYEHDGGLKSYVHVYQVQVPVGDCSIILLCTPDPEIIPERKKAGMVTHAVLVDGGTDMGQSKTSTKCRDALWKTIVHINDCYLFDGNTDRLRFHSWVITHWDRDHYSGSANLVVDRYKQRRSRNFQDNFGNPDNLGQCEFFWLGPNFATTLYIPNDTNMPKKYKGPPKELFKLEKTGAGCGIVQLYVGDKQTVDGTMPDFQLFCQYVTGYENLIGRDIFTGTLPASGRNVNDLGSNTLENWMLGYDVAEPARSQLPRLVCVAADCRVAGLSNPATDFSSADGTRDNAMSVIMVVVWPACMAGPGGALRISYYAGGDALTPVEEALTYFLNGYTDNVDPANVRRITVMKASHHGARTSSSPALIACSRPKTYLISAGGLHGHPNWTLVCMLHALFRCTLRDRALRHSGPLLPVVSSRYPYYMTNELHQIKTTAVSLDLIERHKASQNNVNALYMALLEGLAGWGHRHAQPPANGILVDPKRQYDECIKAAGPHYFIQLMRNLIDEQLPATSQDPQWMAAVIDILQEQYPEIYDYYYASFEEELRKKTTVDLSGEAKVSLLKTHLTTALKAYWEDISSIEPELNDPNKPPFVAVLLSYSPVVDGDTDVYDHSSTSVKVFNSEVSNMNSTFYKNNKDEEDLAWAKLLNDNIKLFELAKEKQRNKFTNFERVMLAMNQITPYPQFEVPANFIFNAAVDFRLILHMHDIEAMKNKTKKLGPQKEKEKGKKEGEEDAASPKKKARKKNNVNIAMSQEAAGKALESLNKKRALKEPDSAELRKEIMESSFTEWVLTKYEDPKGVYPEPTPEGMKAFMEGKGEKWILDQVPEYSKFAQSEATIKKVKRERELNAEDQENEDGEETVDGHQGPRLGETQVKHGAVETWLQDRSVRIALKMAEFCVTAQDDFITYPVNENAGQYNQEGFFNPHYQPGGNTGTYPMKEAINEDPTAQSKTEPLTKVLIEKLTIKQQQVENIALSTIEGHTDDMPAPFAIKNFQTALFMRYLDEQSIKFDGNVRPQSSGKFSGKINSSNQLLRWLEATTKGSSLTVQGTITAPKDINAALDVKLDGLELRTPISSDGTLALQWTTEPQVLEYYFGKICTGRNGLQFSPGSILFGLDPSKSEGMVFGLGDILMLSGMAIPLWVQKALDLLQATPKKAANSRSGFWIVPGVQQQSFLRLELQLENPKEGSGIKKFLDKFVPDLKLDQITLLVKRSLQQINPEYPTIAFKQTSEIWIQSYIMGVSGNTDQGSQGARLSIGLGNIGLRLSIQWTQSGSSFSTIRKWINDRISNFSKDAAEVPDMSSVWSNSFSTPPGGKSWLDCIHLRSVTLDIAEYRIQAGSIMVEVDLPFGAPPGEFNTIVLSLSFQGPYIRFVGELLGKYVETTESEAAFALSPAYEPFTDISPFAPRAGCRKSISLKLLDPDNEIKNWPSWIPPEVTELALEVQHSPDVTKVSFRTTVGWEESASNVPMFQIDELKLYASIEKHKGGQKRFEFRFSGVVNLWTRYNGPDDAPFGKLFAELEYSTPGSWRLQAGAKGMQLSALGDLFEPGDVVDNIMDLLETVYLHELSIGYQFDGASPSELTVTAIMRIAKVEFSFLYTHYGKTPKSLAGADASKINWLISAEARPAPGALAKNPTIGEWIADIADDDIAAGLPEFVTNTIIPIDTLVASIRCFSTSGYTAFVFRLSIKGFGFEFIQLYQHPSKDAVGEAKGAGTTPAVKKPATRILRIKLDGFPDAGDLPLVGEVKQPLEQIDFVWANLAITRDKATFINAQVLTGPNEKLNWKKPVGESPKADDVFIEKGLHFMVIMNLKDGPQVILDHVFGQSAPSKAIKPGESSTAGAKTTAVAGPTSGKQPTPPEPSSSSQIQETTAPSSPAKFEKKTGPLSISNVSLKYKNQVLTILFNADVKIGPLEFALMGFGLDINLKGVSLHDLRKLDIKPSLSGLGLQVKSGKITLAGLFERIDDPTVTGFLGGLSITMPQYAFLGAGAYLEEKSGYKSVFGFLMVTGPLMHFGWAEIRGITGGFGYNSTLRIPLIHEVDRFPLLANTLSADKGPLDQLTEIRRGGWIEPKKDTIWLAAGLTVKAFQVVDVQAVVTIEMGDNLKIGIVGRAVATVPPGQTDRGSMFLMIVLDVVGSLDFGKGALSIQGQLNPASFILNSSCHPTGGFAVCSWFDPSPHAGDWVFTVGGYHPAYAKPAHYPDAQRLGISWKYDSNISITGEAYFAITPRMCMGGGKLSIVFSMGSISAYLIAYADFLMNYEPFQYMIAVGVSIGVSYTLKIWFIHKKFSIDIAARVTLQGPPLSGHVYVDLKVISFTIAFGASRQKRPPLSLDAFWKLLVQASEAEKKEAPTDHVFAVVNGLIPTKENKAGHLGTLRAGILEIQVHSRAALSEVYLLGKPNLPDLTGKESIYANPTRVQYAMSSTATIEMTLQGDLQSTRVNDKFIVSPVYKPVPSGLWSRYDPNEDPSDDKSSTGPLRSKKKPTIVHLMGFNLKPRAPKLEADDLPAFSVDELLMASNPCPAEFPVSEEVISDFLPGVKPATKEKLIGVWGGNTTTTPLDINLILSGFSKGMEYLTKEESKYSFLPTRAPTQVFNNFDLIYSAGAPRLAASKDNSPPQFVAGEWSTKWENSDGYKLGSDSRSSIDLESYAGASIASVPKLHYGINRIDFQKSTSYRFNTSVELMKYESNRKGTAPIDTTGANSKGRVLSVKASSWPDSVINECDVTWLAVFNNHPSRDITDIQTGICGLGEYQPGMSNVTVPKGVEAAGTKKFTTAVNFTQAYESEPAVVVWLTSVNVAGAGIPRIKVEVTDITKTGCNIVFSIWSQGDLKGIACSWLSHPISSQTIRSGNFNTSMVRNVNAPRKITSGRETFANFKFKRVPSLLVGLNHIECGSQSDFRAGVTVSDVKKNNFIWHCSTWGFTHLHVAGAAYIAFDA